MRTALTFIVGVVLLFVSHFMIGNHDVFAILGALVMALGGALVVWAVALMLDNHSPTSRKL